MEIGNAGNVYLDENAPWSLFKQGGPASEAAAKVCVCSASIAVESDFM